MKDVPLRYGVVGLILLVVLAACNERLVRDPQSYTKMTIYNEMPRGNSYWGGGGPVVVEDKELISGLIEKVNKSDRQNLSEITWERGPGLRIVLERENAKREIKAFVSGDVVTDKYVVDCNIDFSQFWKE